MNYYKIILFLFIFTQCTTTVTYRLSEEIDPGKANDIRRLIVITKSNRFATQLLSKVLIKYQVSYPGIKNNYWQEFKKEIDIDELTGQLVPVFNKHFSHEEIKEMLTFYESPVGKKITNMLPDIMMETSMVGIQWVRKITTKINVMLQREGHINNEINHGNIL